MASACVTNIKIEPYTWRTPAVSSPDMSPPDFEFFRSDDPTVTMLPADELFSDGKLKPISTVRSSKPLPGNINNNNNNNNNNNSTLSHSQPDPFFSPRAPTCSIRWKNILRLKRLNKPSSNSQITPPNPKPNTFTPSRSFSRPFKHPDSDTDSVSTSSRLSLSSTSSSSLDDKPVSRPRAGNPLVESPRLNSNGKVVFERSTSSPGSFNNNNKNNNNSNISNGMRIERSYSAHVVRVAPVLNVVPVKFGFFSSSSSSKRECLGNGRVRARSIRGGNRTDQA